MSEESILPKARRIAGAQETEFPQMRMQDDSPYPRLAIRKGSFQAFMVREKMPSVERGFAFSGEMSFGGMVIFYRILGNDIPLRHGTGQTLIALQFILENEPELAGCEKRFLLNRIVDPSIGGRMKSMLDAAGRKWHEIPFDQAEFGRLETTAEKARYLTNQNMARNRCIDLALAECETVLPFDGQTFFTLDGWNHLLNGLRANPAAQYVTVPMFRLSTNAIALARWNRIGVEDANHIRTEPQLAVRRDYDVRFNEALSYGQANKVELLMRLGVPGPWDRWPAPLFESIRSNLAVSRSRSFGLVPQAGFVLRLQSGNWFADCDISLRSQARSSGLAELVARVHAAYG